MGIFNDLLRGATQQLSREMSRTGSDLVKGAATSVRNGVKSAIKDVTSSKKESVSKPSETTNTTSSIGVKDVSQRLKEVGMEEKAAALSAEADDLHVKLGMAAMSGNYGQIANALKDTVGFAGKAANAQMSGMAEAADFLSEGEGGNPTLSGFGQYMRDVGARLENDGNTVQNS